MGKMERKAGREDAWGSKDSWGQRRVCSCWGEEAGGLEVGGTTVMCVNKKHWSKPITRLRRDVHSSELENPCGQDKHSEKAVLTSTDSQPHKITESSAGG